jgi:hypothetical protein
MVGETFNDTRFAAAQRQLAAQQAQAQMVAATNVNAARAEAEKRAVRGGFTTIPTATGQKIMRNNNIGAPIPSISTYRNLTLNGSPVQRAMSPNPAFKPNIVVENEPQPQINEVLPSSLIFLLFRKYCLKKSILSKIYFLIFKIKF